MVKYSLSVWSPEDDSVIAYDLIDSYLVGRNPPRNTIIPYILIKNKFVSGTHCTLILLPPDNEHHDSYYSIRDGNIFSLSPLRQSRSTNGTWINKSQIGNAELELYHQDIITFGGNQSPKATFRIEGLLEKDETGTFPSEIDI